MASQCTTGSINEVVDGYFARHKKVKQGVTGWPRSMAGAARSTADEKIPLRTEYDLHYIENWTLWFDPSILFPEPIRLLKSENAY